MRQSNINLLEQLCSLLSQLSDAEYARPLPILSGNTIGKHVRHILEFYQCLIEGVNQNTVDYDNRKRDLNLETQTNTAFEAIRQVNLELIKLEQKNLNFMATLPQKREELQTNTERELLYVLEHTVHHFAIIKIAVLNEYPRINLDENFGVAYATIAYHQQTSA